MTSQGTAHGRFTRAIQQRNLFMAEVALLRDDKGGLLRCRRQCLGGALLCSRLVDSAERQDATSGREDDGGLGDDDGWIGGTFH
jgi:hypothetical protein